MATASNAGVAQWRIKMLLLSMLFCHIVDDYYLQGWLASAKQKKYWEGLPNYSDKYKFDYIVALFMHSMSWAFMIMLPIAIYNRFEVGTLFFGMYIFNTLFHAFVDNAKANWLIINLVQDQLLHIAQIVFTWMMFGVFG